MKGSEAVNNKYRNLKKKKKGAAGKFTKFNEEFVLPSSNCWHNKSSLLPQIRLQEWKMSNNCLGCVMASINQGKKNIQMLPKTF